MTTALHVMNNYYLFYSSIRAFQNVTREWQKELEHIDDQMSQNFHWESGAGNISCTFCLFIVNPTL